ncbi:unnamed protein product [Linum tenue]|uniref:Non-haem dioxygenase N-terminal domain-containing protein n=1 Tax=Linum tenue TaxID=586396 RepID=A0AAV0K0K3_9ROSI|nr:unnamed protein product [Linum tenue]
MAASSSAAHDQHNLPNPYSAATATAAPPPTPSAQPNHSQNHHHLTTSASMAADTLSRLLTRLPPSLSLPARLRPSPLSAAAPAVAPPIPPPIITLSDSNATELVLSAASEHGFFQLAGHGIAPRLADSAESESLALFELPDDRKEMQFPRNWPLGFEPEEEDRNGGSFWLDDSATTELTSLSSLRELTHALEKVGLEVVEMLARGVGFENPFKGGEDPTRLCSVMVLSESETTSGGETPSGGGFYPYVVGLQYQIRRQKKYLLPGSGSDWVTVLPEVESVLVTVGDIGQVWSNGKLKKVRGRAVPCLEELGNDKKRSNLGSKRNISMTLLLTLPLESTISPLVSDIKLESNCEEKEEEGGGGSMKFRSIEMEDYAWRVYHEPFLFKDPLDRYRF